MDLVWWGIWWQYFQYLLFLDIGAEKIVIFMDFCDSCLPIFYPFYFFGMVIGAG